MQCYLFYFFENVLLYKRTCLVNPYNERKRQTEINHAHNTPLRYKRIDFGASLISLAKNFVANQFIQLLTITGL